MRKDIVVLCPACFYDKFKLNKSNKIYFLNVATLTGEKVQIGKVPLWKRNVSLVFEIRYRACSVMIGVLLFAHYIG